MIIGSAVVNIRILGPKSLKEKRGIVASALHRLRRVYNAAAAEVGAADFWQKAEIGIAVVSTSAKHAERQLRAIIYFLESEPRFEIISSMIEIL